MGIGYSLPSQRHLAGFFVERFTLSGISRRRLHNFAANRRGLWSLRIFAVLFLVTLFAEFIANDKPILVHYRGELYAPILRYAKDFVETSAGILIQNPINIDRRSLSLRNSSQGKIIQVITHRHMYPPMTRCTTIFPVAAPFRTFSISASMFA